MKAEQYAAHRALNELDARRKAGELSETGMYPVLRKPSEYDDTVPMLPALIRRQAE